MLRTASALVLVALLSACAAGVPGEGSSTEAAAPRADAALQTVLALPHRTPEQRARDQYRRPAETLAFWGLRPGATVVEIGPGEGWWTEILAPYAARTGGRYVMALADISNPALSATARANADTFEARYRAQPALYGDFGRTGFGQRSGALAPAGSVDTILVARAFHNWARQEGYTDKAMRDFAAALKPGGVLAVEQHRAPEGASPTAGTGYVPESYVIGAAERAGLVLDARSEINANPADDRDHPFGVWTLRPIRTSTQAGRTLTPEERAQFDAIGESDRMTLRFRKPA